jgi:hypothetical protein
VGNVASAKKNRPDPVTTSATARLTFDAGTVAIGKLPEFSAWNACATQSYQRFAFASQTATPAPPATPVAWPLVRPGNSS